jgi:hypothetical protein
MVDDQCDVDLENDDHTFGDTGADSPIGRRSYLKLTGTAAASLAAVNTVGRASAATNRHGISFSRVVNVVDDLGVDPSGGRVDDAIGQHAEGGTLLVFPEGEYQFEQTQSVSSDSGVVGFLGQGDVKFVPPQGLNDTLLAVNAGQVLLENIDVDLTADNTVTGFTVHSQDGFHVEDVEFVGRGLHEDRRTTNYISLSVSNPDATGVLKNFVVKKGDAWSHYRGATGIWVGARHQGTVKIADCHIEECGGDGIYASRNNGKVQIEGGVFRNNNVCSVRISGEGSYVDGAVVEVAPEKYTGPHTQEDNAFNLRGVVIEQKTASQSLTKPAGAKVRNCDITIEENPTSGAGISAWSNGKTLTVENTRIRMGNDSPAVRREGRRNQGKNPPTGSPRWLRMNNCVVTGSASSGTAILATDANGSEITNCYIKQTGANRDGVQFVDSSNTLVRNTIINVAGQAVNFNSSSGETINIDHSGSVPSGDIGASSPNNSQDELSLNNNQNESPQNNNQDESSKNNNQDESSRKSDGNSSQETGTDSIEQKADGGSSSAPVKKRDQTESKPSDTTGSDSATEHTLEIEGKGSKTTYSFASDGQVGTSRTLANYETDDDVFVGENWASGFVVNYQDGFTFTGSLTTFALNGDATVRIDGEEVDPNELGTSGENDSSLPHTLVVEGGEPGTLVRYTLSVSGSLRKGDYSDSSETVNGSSARGAVNGKRDSFGFSGRITQFEIDGDADISFK